MVLEDAHIVHDSTCRAADFEQENTAVRHKVPEWDWGLLNEADDLIELEDMLERLLLSAGIVCYTEADTNYTPDCSLAFDLQMGKSAESGIQQASPKEQKKIVGARPATLANPWLVAPARLQTYLPC